MRTCKALLLIMVMLTLQGCGDLLSKKVVKRELDSSQFRASCELNVDAFSEIMHENISQDIHCLEENLYLFIKVVKSGRPGYLGRVEFENFLRNNRPDIKPEIIKALKSVFDVSFLITGEDRNFISKDNVKKVVDFLLIFNLEAAQNFGPIFENEGKVSYALHQNHRDRVKTANLTIVGALRNIFNPNRGTAVHELNIVELLKSFATDDNVAFIDKVQKVLFIKKLLFGGESEILTHHELKKLLEDFDSLSLMVLDAVRYKNILLDQADLLSLLKRDLGDLTDIFMASSLGDRSQTVFFTIEEAISAAKVFIKKETLDFDNFKKLITEAKKMAMGWNGTNASPVTGAEVKALFDHGNSLLQTGTVFHRIYDKFRIALDSPLPVDINFEDYRRTYPMHEKELKQFERIVKRYRFMRGEFESAYFTKEYRRNADATFETAVFEYLLQIVFKSHGSKSANSLGGYAMTGPEVYKLIRTFENELIELDLILPQRSQGIADNISLLGTLFQYQSDDNGLLDVNEATEFGISLMASLNMANASMDYFREKGCEFDEYDRVEPNCFRTHFFGSFCANYRTYFPLMFQYYGASKCEDFVDTADTLSYLNMSVEAARTCNYYTDGKKEEIYFNNGDIFSIYMVMIHAETTVLRWDNPFNGGNNNNILDASEMDKAYSIYSPALDGFLTSKPAIIKSLKKQIYQYLIKYERVPDDKEFKSVWKFVKFLLSFDKKAPAKRKTLAAILRTIGQENMKLNPGTFDCNWMRNPTTIPRLPEVDILKQPNLSPEMSEEESELKECLEEKDQKKCLKSCVKTSDLTENECRETIQRLLLTMNNGEK